MSLSFWSLNKKHCSVSAYTLFSVFILYFFIYFLNYHYQIITCPYPLEYREGANVLPTALLLEGKNPFDYANNPQYTNVYGIFYALLVLPLAKIWGPTLLLHRLVTGFFLFACGFILICVLRKDKTPLLLSAAAGVFLYPFLLFPDSSTPLARPDTLGLFLFLAAFFVPYLFNYSRTSLGISLLAALLAFYTKPYFLLAVPLTASYIFLFKSKRTGLLYGLGFLFIFILSIYAANRAMNCYFNNIFFAQNDAVAATSPTVGHAIAQLKYFYQLQKPLFLFLALYLIVAGTLYIKNFKKQSLKNFFSEINIVNWQGPLLLWDFPVSLWGLIVTTLTIYFLLGRSLGQFMPYLYQLMSPFLILCVFQGLGKARALMLSGMVLIVINLFALSSHFPKNFHEYDDNWNKVEGLIAAHKNIFASPMFVPLLIKHHCLIYDSGQSEYFQGSAHRTWLHYKWPIPPEVKNRTAQLEQDVWAMVAGKKFDFIMIIPNYHPFLSNYCIMYYRPIGAIKLNNFQNSHEGTDEFILLAPK